MIGFKLNQSNLVSSSKFLPICIESLFAVIEEV